MGEQRQRIALMTAERLSDEEYLFTKNHNNTAKDSSELLKLRKLALVLPINKKIFLP
jgi:hypothetical protein